MPGDMRRHDIGPDPATAHSPRLKRLRTASLSFNLCTLFVILAPTLHTLGIKQGLLLAFNAALLLGGWGLIALARDRHLRVLMAFGSRSSRERVAHAQPRKLVLDEFDFHLRGEAFRVSYQIIASLIALAGSVGFVIHAFTEVQVSWNLALALTFPFGILWLLALPTTVVVWLIGPDVAADDGEPGGAP